MKPPALQTPTFGVIYGNRDFFPDEIVSEARADLAKVFETFGIRAKPEAKLHCREELSG